MKLNIKEDLAHESNYGGKRTKKQIKYIGMHYTSNDGDTDEANGNYFDDPNRKASAHYFVDSDSITRSVPDLCVAWSVGGNKWNDCAQTGGGTLYGICTNDNSLNIELCDDKKDGIVKPSEATIALAVELVKAKMKEYNIPLENVVRHFDVNGKHCPAYWCGDEEKDKLWLTEFKNRLSEGSEASGTTTPTKPAEPTTSTTPTKPAEENQANDPNDDFIIRVEIKNLRIRKKPSLKGAIVGYIAPGVYTIISTKKADGHVWGELKSGAGYIALEHTTTLKEKVSNEFQIRVRITNLILRGGPGRSFANKGYIAPGVYTIVATQTADGFTWGKLKSGAGYIALEHTTTV